MANRTTSSNEIKRSFPDILFLCLRSKCPVCGRGNLFIPWSKIRSIADICIPPRFCNACGFQFGREPGYYFGVVTPILPILSLVAGLTGVALYYFITRPSEPSELLLPGMIGTALGFIVFFRPAIAFYVSLDHAIDPPKKNSRSDPANSLEF